MYHVSLKFCIVEKQIQNHTKVLILCLTLTLTHKFTLKVIKIIYIGLSVRNDTKVLQIGQH